MQYYHHYHYYYYPLAVALYPIITPMTILTHCIEGQQNHCCVPTND